jgi:predicted GNAT superfamily acetyltransferase
MLTCSAAWPGASLLSVHSSTSCYVAVLLAPNYCSSPLGQVLLLLVKLYEASERPSWISISQCLVFLDQPAEVAAILHRLLGSSEVCTKWL